MNRVSKPFFFGSYLVAVLLAAPLSIGPAVAGAGDREAMQELLPFTLLGGLIGLYAFIVLAIFVYKMWTVVPSSAARTTPGKAVGFLFIPIFNLYWMFVALWGWAKDWNAYAAGADGQLRRTSEGLPLVIAVFGAVGGSIGTIAAFAGAPWLASLLGAPNYALIPLFIYEVCDLLNSVPDIPCEPAAGTPYVSPQKGATGFGVASLVLGIVSILLPYLGLICGIVAIVLARKQRKVFREPLSLAGLITGIIGTALWGLTIIVLLLIIIAVGASEGF
jgi:hypothetical protein